jgi:hypothetical protein
VSCGTGLGDICANTLSDDKTTSAVPHDDRYLVRMKMLLQIGNRAG